MALRNWLAGLAIVAGVVGLALDFYVISDTMVASPENPVARSFLDMFVYYWTFLTNLSNLALLLIYMSALTGWRWLGWFRSPVSRGGMAGIIVLVMAYYHFMLAPQYHFTGPIVVSNDLLHYVTPILYLIWWAAFVSHGRLRVRNVPVMLVPGLAYVAYVLIRGPIAGEYPYTIIDPTFAPPGQAAAQGYFGVAIGVGILILLVAIFDLLLVGIDGLIARRRKPARSTG
jgi:hypothetical protein